MASSIDVTRTSDGCDHCAGRFDGNGGSEGFAGDYRSPPTRSLAEPAVHRLRWNAKDRTSMGAKRYAGRYRHCSSERWPRTGDARESDADGSTCSRAHPHRCTLLPAARRFERTFKEETDIDLAGNQFSDGLLGQPSGSCARRFFLGPGGSHWTDLNPVSS